MKIDLSGVLFTNFEKVRDEYDKAKGKGDTEEAKRLAKECARILLELAKSAPQQKKMYLESAEKWKNIAKGIVPPTTKPLMEKGEISPDDLTGFAESLISRSNVTWNDIGGLGDVKVRIMETIVLAGLKKPETIKPDKGILLFGPPGTGKTLLAAAAAGSLDATFFNVKISNVLSKYFGESSKLVSALYTAARERAPAIVFIDEFDAITTSRGGDSSEASRKVLSTLLAELDGFQDKKSDKLILTLSATNTPWDLDEAILSRFPTRIYIPLPDSKACLDIIQINLKGLDVSALNMSDLSTKCVENHYSGRDIHYLCQEAIRHMIRAHNPNLAELSALPFDELKNRSLKVGPITMENFTHSFGKIKSPLSKEDIERHVQWNKKFGGL